MSLILCVLCILSVSNHFVVRNFSARLCISNYILCMHLRVAHCAGWMEALLVFQQEMFQSCCAVHGHGES